MVNISILLIAGVMLAILLAFKPNRLVVSLSMLFQITLLVYVLGFDWLLNSQSYLWSATIGMRLAYRDDGLAQLFVLLVSGIGLLIVGYARVYLQFKPQNMAKLMSLLQLFSVSMLGLVWMDDMLALFVFWELTGISSYLLIQFDESDGLSNQAAFNAFFISALGGLAMLAGFILLHEQTGTWSIQATLSQLAPSANNNYMTSILVLLLLGALTKSAQFPFHFWLPGAMRAPTPVSAYLHSATMVNAGIYLLARFHPLFGQSPLWYYVLATTGLMTMVTASFMSLLQDDLKSLLAYSTLFALGSMAYLLASDHWLSAEALALFLLFHGLYKAAAFMLVGTLDQEYGTRRLSQLQGIGRYRPVIGLFWVVVFSAMAGWPPLYGFVVKQMVYEAKLAKAPVSFVFIAASFVSSLLISATGLKCLWSLLRQNSDARPLKKLPYGLVAPGILVVGILLLSFFNVYVGDFVKAAADHIVPRHTQPYYTPQWPSLLLSLAALLGGIVIFIGYRKGQQMLSRVWPQRLSFATGFEKSVNMFVQGLGKVIDDLQKASLSRQMAIIMAIFTLLLTSAMMMTGLGAIDLWTVQPRLWLIAVLMISVAVSLIYSRTFLTNMVSFSVLGLTLSYFFMTQGAPDVAMTQLLVEILTVVILVLALQGLSLTYKRSKGIMSLLRLGLASLTGLAFTMVLAGALSGPAPGQLKAYFIEHSLALAHGRNVVNVILVDFRAFDTLGEVIVVLGATVGVWLLARRQFH